MEERGDRQIRLDVLQQYKGENGNKLHPEICNKKARSNQRSNQRVLVSWLAAK